MTAGGVVSVAAPAGDLTGTELKSTVVTSSLTSVGTLTGLTVDAGINIGQSNSAIDIQFKDASDASRAYIRANHTAVGDIGINTEGNQPIILNSSGTGGVGIGTATQASGAKLTVSGGYIVQTDGTITTYIGSDGTGSMIGPSTNHYLRFITNDTERMQITAGGDIGIAATKKIYLDGSAATGNTYIVENSADNMQFHTGGTLAVDINSSQAVQLAGDLYVLGTGPHSFGTSAGGNFQFRFGGAYTSTGASDNLVGFETQSTLTGASGDTSFLVGNDFSCTIATQTATESIALIAQARFQEPTITDNLTGDITVASTVYIKDAPTEGEDNYALFVDSGAVRFDGDVAIGSVTAPVTKLHVADNAHQSLMPGTQQAIISGNDVSSTTNWQLAIEGNTDSGILFTEDNAKRGMVGYDAGKDEVFVGDHDGDARWAVSRVDNTARCYTHDIQAIHVDSVQDVHFANNILLGGSAAANKLHDYEEGTFTPALVRTSLDVSYSAQEGKYTKVGNVVTITIMIILDGVTTSGSGNVTLSGLPYNNGSVTTYSTVMKVGYNDTFDANIQGAYIYGSTLYFIPVGPTQSNFAGVVSTGYLGITGTYIANT
jgi:hypothetical protein